MCLGTFSRKNSFTSNLVLTGLLHRCDRNPGSTYDCEDIRQEILKNAPESPRIKMQVFLMIFYMNNQNLALIYWTVSKK